MISHDKEGAFGLVVNRQSNLSIDSAIPEFADLELPRMPIYIGGPVQQEYLFFLNL